MLPIPSIAITILHQQQQQQQDEKKKINEQNYILNLYHTSITE